MEHDWIQLDPSELAQRVRVELNGAVFELEPSIYDRPEAIRGTWSEDRSTFSVEFRYVGDAEREVELRHIFANGAARVWVGNNSRRIMRIAFELQKMASDGSAKIEYAEIERVAGIVLGGRAVSDRVGNMSAAKQAFNKVKGELVAG